MSETPLKASEHPKLWRYELRVQGHLDHRWADWFEGLSLTYEEGGTTLLYSPVLDQAALYGLLRKVRDLGVPLISLTRVNPSQEAVPNSDQ